MSADVDAAVRKIQQTAFIFLVLRKTSPPQKARLVYQKEPLGTLS